MKRSYLRIQVLLFVWNKNEIKKAPATSHRKDFFYIYEQRGWEKSFTGQTKGYMFVGDQLHI